MLFKDGEEFFWEVWSWSWKHKIIMCKYNLIKQEKSGKIEGKIRVLPFHMRLWNEDSK
jgi:hypothetical protein